MTRQPEPVEVLNLRPWPYWPANSDAPPSINSDSANKNAEQPNFSWGPPVDNYDLALAVWCDDGGRSPVDDIQKPKLPVWSINCGITFDRFAALFSPGFESIEAAVPRLVSPNHSFRQALINIIWRFYRYGREEGAMVSPGDIKGDAQKALSLSAELSMVVERLAKAQNPVISRALSPYAAMRDEHGEHPAGRHPSGIGLVGVLAHLERDMKRANRSLRRDRGGLRRSIASTLLLRELLEWRQTWSLEHTPRGSRNSFLEAVLAGGEP